MLFSYKIADKEGKIKKGELEARDLKEARSRLSSQEGDLVSVAPIKKSKKKQGKGMHLAIGRIRLVDKMMFAKHLAVMIKSGMPLDESLDTLSQQASPVFAKKVKNVLENIRQGNSFSNALKKHARVFDSMFINMVAAGEVSGNLEKNLELVAVQQYKSYTLRSKIKAAMMYPTVIFIAILGLIAVISMLVLPKLIGFFSTLDAKLPVSTKVLIFSSEFFVSNWIALFSGLILLVIIIRIMSRFSKTRFWLHVIILKLPLFGKISKNINLAVFCRSLSSLLGSGITIDQSLKIVSETVTNDVYKKQVTIIYHQILKGTAFSEILSKDKHFPIIVSRMSKVGERSGNLSETLDYLANFYESEVDTFTKNLSTMLEPALLVIIGLVVGFVAISIINPIYELTSKVGR